MGLSRGGTADGARRVPGVGRRSRERSGQSRTPPCALPHSENPRGVIRHGIARGTGVAPATGMNTRTIESTLDVTTNTHAEVESTEEPLDLLAKKVFAATMAYVIIFITATVLLIAL